MKVSHDDLVRWANPWPIKFRRRLRWRLSFKTVTQCLRYKSFWHVNGRRCCGAATLKLLRGPLANRLHHIEGMARNPTCFQKPVIMVQERVIVDGNHTLLALARRRYKGKVLVCEATR